MKLKLAKWEQKENTQLVANGLIRINPNKSDYGSLMLIATTMSLTKGFANVKPKIGFITGRVNDLNMIIKEFNLKEGDDYSAKVAPHRIITLECLESDVVENEGYRPKINPSTGEALTKDGEQIYWKTEVVPESSEVYDVLVAHDREVDTSLEEFQQETKDSDIIV